MVFTKKSEIKMTTNNKTAKVLIVVSGGVIQSVFSSNQNLTVDLLDFDNEEFETDEIADKEFEKRKKNLQEIL